MAEERPQDQEMEENRDDHPLGPSSELEEVGQFRTLTADPYSTQNKEMGIRLKSKGKRNPAKSDEQIDALIEKIELIFKLKLSTKMMILNNEKVSEESLMDHGTFEVTKRVLGRGSSAGEVVVIRDRKTGCEMAQKTIMLSEYIKDEIRLWVQLAGSNMAPELYSWRIRNNKLEMQMEIVEGKTMESIIHDVWQLHDLGVWKFEDVKSLAFIILHDMLDIFQKMMDLKYSHRDLHSGNVMLEKTMSLKFIDFGLARKHLLKVDTDSKHIQFDVIGIICMFYEIFSGCSFDGTMHAKKLLQSKTLHELDETLKFLSKEDREEMYAIITLLFETVSHPGIENFGDTTRVTRDVEKKISPGEMRTIKKRIAGILFPEILQGPCEDQADGGSSEGESEPDNFEAESEMEKDDGSENSELFEISDPHGIWHSSELQRRAARVTDEDLKKLEGKLIGVFLK